MDFITEMNRSCTAIETTLEEVTAFDDTLAEGEVFSAMGYSLLGGGKRIRGLLVLHFATQFGGNTRAALLTAAAIEMIHAYSLIHDDLPCMDNDTLRRGKPTCHVVYGEAMALLAGDALLNGAYELVSANEMTQLVGEKIQVALLRSLSKAAGRFGMIGGQTIDISSEDKSLTEEELTYLHSLKTGALIGAAGEMGGILGGCTPEQMALIATYTQKVGLAFQISDDILDVVGSQEELGKNIGSDAENHKTTYITLKGLKGSMEMVERLYDESVDCLRELDMEQSFIGELTNMLRTRKK